MRFTGLYHRTLARLLPGMKLTGKTISKRKLKRQLKPYRGADVRVTMPKQRDNTEADDGGSHRRTGGHGGA